MKPLDISDKGGKQGDHEYYVSSAFRQPRATELLNGGAGKIDVEMMKKFIADNENRDKKPLGIDRLFYFQPRRNRRHGERRSV